MKNIKFVFFDRDNTLSYRTRPSNILQELAERLDCNSVWDILEPILTTKYEIPDGFVYLLSKTLGMSKQHISSTLRLMRYFEKIEAEHASYTPFSDTYSILTGLRSKGYKIGIISDMNKEWSHPAPAEKSIFQLFHPCAIHCSYQYGLTKKYPYLYHRICEYHQVEPEECVMIGDRFERDVDTPLNAGFADAVLLHHQEITRRDAVLNQHFHEPTPVGIKYAQSLREAIELLNLGLSPIWGIFL